MPEMDESFKPKVPFNEHKKLAPGQAHASTKGVEKNHQNRTTLYMRGLT